MRSSEDGVLVQAGGVLDLHEARDMRSRSESNEVSIMKCGLGRGGGLPIVVPKKSSSQDTGTWYSNTATATTIESKNGGVLLKGNASAFVQGAQIQANKDLTITGGTVVVTGATNYESSTSERTRKDSNIGTETGWRDLGQGINAKRKANDERQETSVVRTTLEGANVNVSATGANGEGGTLYLAGTTITTPGKLTLEADKLILGTQTTQVDVSSTSEGRDVVWQKAQGAGTSDQTTNYNQFNAGQLATNVNSVQAGLGARDSIQSLAQQPGMGWVNQINSDPKLAGKVDWVKVEEAHTKWDYKQQGLTPEGAAIVTLLAAYFAVPAAQAAGASAGAAVGGGAAGTFVGGAVTAGVTTLASQVAVAVINNKGDLGAALHDLGSSENVKGLVTAMITGGVLQGMDLNPTGQPTVGGGAQKFMTQLGQNLQAGAAKAVIGTAINGGSLEESLKNNLKTAFIDTLAAQGADQIGDWTEDGTLNDVTNKMAHAIAGCAVGAAKADSAGGCGAGALGAAMGELSAELYGRNIDTVQFASMMGGIAVAVAGGDAAQINLGSQTGANAAANNYLNHDQWAKFADDIASCKAKPTGCSPSEEQSIRTAYQNLSDRQNVALANCKTTDNCAALAAQVAPGTRTMLDLVGGGQLPIGGAPGNDLGQYGGERLAKDPAYRAQVNQSIAVLNACNANPASCTQQAIKAAALVVFPLMGLAGVAITVEGAVVGGAVGAVANAGGQVYANNGDVSQINPVDVGMAALTGAMTYGATIWPSLFINTGGAVVTSAVSNASPSGAAGSIAGATLGTAIGYPVGVVIQGGFNGIVNPWYRPLWQDMGFTITRWVTPSPVPSIFGTMGGGVTQEATNAAINGQNVPANSGLPTRGGQ